MSPVRERWERRRHQLNQAITDLQGHGVIGDQATFPRSQFMNGRTHADELDQLKRKRAYAVARCAKLSVDIAPRLDGCGTEFLPIACRCGLVGATQQCRQWWLCGDCRAKRSPLLGQDIRRGLDAALRDAVDEWGREGGRGTKPAIVLLTLTQEHSGDLVADQAALADGWRKLYKRMHEDHGRFAYVGVWEVTPGRDGLGHVHMHVAAVWRYRDWSRVREQWLRACPSSQYLDIKRKRRDGKASSAGSVSKYLGKYLSKGVESDKFTPYLRAEVSAAFYNQRSVITSVHFWRRLPKCCSKCLERYRLVEIERPSLEWRLPSITVDVYGSGLEPPSNLSENRTHIVDK